MDCTLTLCVKLNIAQHAFTSMEGVDDQRPLQMNYLNDGDERCWQGRVTRLSCHLLSADLTMSGMRGGRSSLQRTFQLLQCDGAVRVARACAYPLMCPSCRRTFRHVQSLNRHKWKCLGLRKIQCDLCGRITYRLDYHKAHMLRVHGLVDCQVNEDDSSNAT